MIIDRQTGKEQGALGPCTSGEESQARPLRSDLSAETCRTNWPGKRGREQMFRAEVGMKARVQKRGRSG